MSDSTLNVSQTPSEIAAAMSMRTLTPLLRGGSVVCAFVNSPKRSSAAAGVFIRAVICRRSVCLRNVTTD